MLLIDEVLERSEDRIICGKTFQADEFFFQGHYPGKPITPGVILCESAMQAGAVLLAQHMEMDGGVPVATRLNDVRFRRMIQPGDTITIEVELTERVANAFFLKAKATCDGKLAVRFEFVCAMADPTQQQ